MPKIKMPRSSPSLDMTPMVDLAFLLVTFFMLTAQFRPEESAVVDTPSSQSVMPVPKDDIVFITIDTSGRVYWDFKEGKIKLLGASGVRSEVLEYMSGKYKVGFTPEQKDKFVKLSGIGVPIDKLPGFLDLRSGDQRKAYNLKYSGIPCDSVDNQLREWLRATRTVYYSLSNAQPTVVIKADGDADYAIINKIIKIFQDKMVGINRFKLVTDLEK